MIDRADVEYHAGDVGFWQLFWLWCSLVCPSSYVVHKYLGWEGVLAYAMVAAAAIPLALKFPAHPARRHVSGLALITVLIVAGVFLAVYPVVNTHEPGRGSDDDDAYNLGATALVTGHFPYAQTTYLGNALYPLPGAFVLAAPFVLLGTSALQNLFWLPMFFFAVKEEAGDARTALRLAWLVLILAPAVMHEVVTGVGHASNTIYVLLGLWWLLRTRHRDLAAIAWGVTLASRANFLFLVPLAFGWLRQHDGWRVAWRATALACGVCACLTVPFYLYDPGRFGPLEASDRLRRFDALLPHLGIALMAAMAALSIGLALTRMAVVALFRNCAVVQAFPVVAGLMLSTVQDGRPDLRYAAYGTFFAWFVLMALGAQLRISGHDVPTCHER